jgi:glucan phosphoethanolaminetransferase (alkaline phosphatase superfamily)
MLSNTIHPNEPVLSLPTSRLVTAVALAAAMTGSIWVGVCLILRQSSGVQIAGLLAAAVVLAVSIAGILAITPWKTRPISTWMTLWLAGMVIRMLATPAITFVLYFAVPAPTPGDSGGAAALALAVALVYLVVVLTEAIVVARHVSKATTPAQLTRQAGQS